VSSAKVQRQRLVRILHEDPDLARRLDPVEAELAARQTVGYLEQVAAGPWQPSALAQERCLYGGVILSGLMVREVNAGTGTTAELLGAGEVILPCDTDDARPFVAPAAGWTALEATRIAWLDAPFGLALRRWPELGAALIERSQRRADRLALSQAISQLTRVDERVQILLWHLAERWGRVRPDGVVLPIKLTHRVLARLIGARRPSVTTAVGTLERDGRLERMDKGGWVLHGEAPEMLGELSPIVPAAPPAPWQHGRTGGAALAMVGEPIVAVASAPVDREAAFRERADHARLTAQALRVSSRVLIERARTRRRRG
jgi:CRP/FNR family transcriptional regulator, cyclic AMP receptor protein